MLYSVAGFGWDDGNRDKCRRHGVPLDDVEAVFHRPLRLLPDPAHSASEERFKAIGASTQGRHIFVVFTLRRRDGDMLIRPISARYMHRRGVTYCEEAASKARER